MVDIATISRHIGCEVNLKKGTLDMHLQGRQTTGRFIALLHRMSSLYLGQELPSVKIGTGQYIFLAELFDEDGLSQEELTKRVFVDKANTARALKKLEDVGYVRRMPDKNDGRIKRVFLQPSARAIEKEFWNIITLWSEIICHEMPQERQDSVIRDLQTMAENAANHLQRY
ncbi:MarR family transcriptional regulator [Pseudodesulfovibrio sp. S3-i]|nr:MarR family transcriptional regulator [Pseudodesulfovibrio sp. S3-i]